MMPHAKGLVAQCCGNDCNLLQSAQEALGRTKFVFLRHGGEWKAEVMSIFRALSFSNDGVWLFLSICFFTAAAKVQQVHAGLPSSLPTLVI